MWVPEVEKLVEKVVTPELSVALPNVVLASIKVTEPLAVVGLTLAVKVTLWPMLTKLLEALSVVLDDVNALTVSLTDEEVLLA